METAGSSETLVPLYRTAGIHIAEDNRHDPFPVLHTSIICALGTRLKKEGIRRMNFHINTFRE
jgi:hypothetical protein